MSFSLLKSIYRSLLMVIISNRIHNIFIYSNLMLSYLEVMHFYSFNLFDNIKYDILGHNISNFVTKFVLHIRTF